MSLFRSCGVHYVACAWWALLQLLTTQNVSIQSLVRIHWFKACCQQIEQSCSLNILRYWRALSFSQFWTAKNNSGVLCVWRMCGTPTHTHTEPHHTAPFTPSPFHYHLIASSRAFHILLLCVCVSMCLFCIPLCTSLFLWRVERRSFCLCQQCKFEQTCSITNTGKAQVTKLRISLLCTFERVWVRECFEFVHEPAVFKTSFLVLLIFSMVHVES